MKTHRMVSLGLGFLWALAVTGCAPSGTIDAEDGEEGLGDEAVGEAAQAYTAAVGGPVCTLLQDKNGGPPPLNVKLTASCTDPNGDLITAYYFVCGNGQYQFSPSKTFTCNYTTVGNFTPFVQAMDATGAWGAAVWGYVPVAPAPHAEMEVWSANSLVNKKCTKVMADGTGSYSPEGTITSYQWNIGGASYSGATATRDYCNYYGTIPVSLTVTDSFGAVNTQTGSITLCPIFYRDNGYCGGVWE